MQTPAWQLSVVQRSPSSQGVPSAFGGVEQTPVAGLQVPTTRHWSGAVQVTGLLPLQAPPTQVSTWVQALPSLQALPSALGGLEQTPVDGLQMPTEWH